MSAQNQIDNLNVAIKRRGETITIRRGATEVTVKAIVRGKSFSDLPGTTGQTHWDIVISPDGLATLGTPRQQDDVIVKGKECTIESSFPVHVDNTLVRVDMTAAG